MAHYSSFYTKCEHALFILHNRFINKDLFTHIRTFLLLVVVELNTVNFETIDKQLMELITKQLLLE